MRLIGINGFKTSGKDSVYRIIKESANDANVQRIAFADKLKQAAALCIGYECIDPEFDLPEVMMMDQCKETWKFEIWDVKGGPLDGVAVPVTEFTGRQYLQYFGQGLRQVFGDTFWIDQVLPVPTYLDYGMALEQRYPGVDLLCVTDVRYPNEAERIKLLEGEMWEVTRPGLESDGHSSEIPLEDHLIDVRILNDGTLEDLATKVTGVLYSHA